MSSTITKDNRDELLKAYKRLLEAREISEFVTAEPPGAPGHSIESAQQINRLKKKFAELMAFPIRKTRITDSLAGLFKKDSKDLVTMIINDMNDTRLRYSMYTIRRSKYGLLSPIAFCSESELPKYLGAPKTDRVFTLTWCPQFQQFSPGGAESGALEIAGITRDGFRRWWSDGQDTDFEQETRAWSDMKNLAFKLVCLLDKTNLDGSATSSGLLSSLRDLKSKKQIENITFQLKRLALSVIRMLFLRHEHFNDVLPLFELLVPATYTLLVVLNLDIKSWRVMGEQVVTMLESYVAIVNELKEKLTTQLGISDELSKFEASDNAALLIPKLSSEVSGTKPDESHTDEKPSPCNDIILALKRLGLGEIELDPESGKHVNGGSFATIFQYTSRVGDYKYAVKYLRMNNGYTKRLEERLLREASRWVVLSHKNINTLLGIYVSPTSGLPGLVSAFCPYTLSMYVEGNVGDQEKLGYLLDVAEGLAYMHDDKRKIAHGDIRPENILLTPADFDYDPNGSHLKAVLTDFGVSDIDEDFDAGNSTTMQRTNGYYLAPELLPTKILPGSKRKKRVTIKGDIYAFGCVFFTVLYGKGPFHYDRKRYLKIKRNGGFPARQKDVSAAHWELLQRTWDSDKDKRPSAMELVDQLQSMVSFASH